ncbi:hypothetical protein OEZ86_002257 [Tetradesmus obliquus]|nr:hypothetical protein OEZ86_002257 [Tetradesmus obliquus]
MDVSKISPPALLVGLCVQVAAVTGTDAVEQWTIINLTGDAHPIHMHKGLFEVVTQEEVVKQEAVTISPTGAFTFTGQLGLPAGLLDG